MDLRTTWSKAGRARLRARLTRLSHGLATRMPYLPVVHERQVWYHSPLEGYNFDRTLPDGATVERVTADQLHVLRATGAWFARSADHLAAGNVLWVLRQDGKPVFTFWIYTRTMPTYGAPHGWVEMPPGVLNLEDSMMAAEYRGRGVAAAAWAQAFASIVRETGAEHITTIIHESNRPTRALAVKLGWRPIATVDIRKVGLVRRTGNWRDRADDHNPMMRTRARIEPFEGTAKIPVSDQADELLAWLRTALVSDVRGPADRTS